MIDDCNNLYYRICSELGFSRCFGCSRSFCNRNFSGRCFGNGLRREQSLHRKLHLALRVNTEAEHFDFVTDVNDVFDLIDAVVGKFGDVHKTVATRQDFDERAKRQ